MNVGRVLGRFAATGLAVGYVGLAIAADEPIRVAPAAPVVAGDPCPTCTAGAAGAPCGQATCGKCAKAGHRAGCNPSKPVVGQLRPGACFGYFQTQWHKWEDVCPLPYQGVGLSDAPKGIPTPGPAVGGPGPKSVTPLPKVVTPLPMPPGGGGVLPIPMPDKFGK